jgi:hypothetical protein
MKLAIRIFALSIVVAGISAAAAISPKAAPAIPSHQSAAVNLSSMDSIPPLGCGGHLCIANTTSSK